MLKVKRWYFRLRPIHPTNKLIKFVWNSSSLRISRNLIAIHSSLSANENGIVPLLNVIDISMDGESGAEQSALGTYIVCDVRAALETDRAPAFHTVFHRLISCAVLASAARIEFILR